MKNSYKYFILLFAAWTGFAMAQPANDVCATSTSLIVSAACTAATSGSVSGAKEEIPAITCGVITSTTAKDVWYNFNAVSGTTYYVTVNSSSGLDVVVDLQGGPCGTPNSLGCADDVGKAGKEILTYNAGTTGTKYIRVYGFTSATDTPTTSTFDICITTTLSGVSETHRKSPFVVFPNPCAGAFHISTSGELNGASFSVINVLGEVVYSSQISKSGNMDIEIQPNPGVYFILLDDGEKQYRYKIVVQ